MSCAGAGSVDVKARTSRHLSTPKRLARVARLLPRPSRRSWRPDPAATHLSAFSEVLGPLPVHASVDSPNPRRQAALRPFSEVRRREPAVVCQQPPVVGSTQLGGHRQSRPRSRRDYRNRGEPAARRLTSASRGLARASSGLCSRPRRAARQLSAWRTSSPTPCESSSAAASRRSACASSGQCSRPPRAARQLSAWRSDRPALRRRTAPTSPKQWCASLGANRESDHERDARFRA